MEPLRRRFLIAAALTAAWPDRPWATEPDARVLTPRPLAFPRDHGSHTDTRTEWWYLTGHASDDTGREFGFQLTFFRSRVDGTEGLRSRLAARQLVFAHAAITDAKGGRLWHEQRIGRWNGEPPGQVHTMVFARTDDTDVAIREWRLRRGRDGRYQAVAHGDDLSIELEATPTQPLLLQGEQGFSRKGPQAAQASFYVSEPQLSVRGTLGLREGRFEVQGRAWLDHEWSESLLHPDAVGWDWLGMNLDDGGALTAFQLRRADRSALWAGGSLRSARGDARHFGPDEVQWLPLRHWVSPRTRARYPVEWQVRTPAGTFSVHAAIDPQELDASASTGTVYWEGLSDLRDSQGRRVGKGYLEMTGYAGRLVL